MADKKREKLTALVSAKPYVWPSNVLGLPANTVIVTTNLGRVLKVEKFTGGKPSFETMQMFFKRVPDLFVEMK